MAHTNCITRLATMHQHHHACSNALSVGQVALGAPLQGGRVGAAAQRLLRCLACRPHPAPCKTLLTWKVTCWCDRIGGVPLHTPAR